MDEGKQTRIIQVDPENPDIEKIRIAADVISMGKLVAFPTETVYGLGADAFNSEAVENIFIAKGRPSDNPLIVHIARREDIKALTSHSPSVADVLISQFWPGPLTLIFPRSPQVPDPVTSGLSTVAIRMPDHIIALALIEEAGTPIAAPSANISGKPSTTTASHVIEDLFGRVDIIVDGGQPFLGVESTVLDITTPVPTLLRPGGIPIEELRRVLGRVDVDLKIDDSLDSPPRSPGMKYKHYSPNAELILVEGKDKWRKVQQLASKLRGQGKAVGIMATSENAGKYKSSYVAMVGSEKDLSGIAANLFSTLRKFDEKGMDVVIAESVSEQGLGFAVMNRLRKAANKIISSDFGVGI